MSLPQLTFIVAAYNAERTLQRTLGSLAVEAPGLDSEILIINDGSTDKTKSIAETFCTLNPNFRLINQDNRGLGAVRNRGVDEARGKYICFCDADDIYFPTNHYEVVKKTEETQSDIGVATAYCFLRYREMEKFWDQHHQDRLILENDAKFQAALRFMLQPHVQARIYRKEFIHQNNIRFSEGRLFEDVEFTYSALLTTERLCFAPLPIWIYNFGEQGAITGTRNKRRLEILDNITPVIQRANRTPRTALESLCLATSLLRCALDCIDNCPEEFLDEFITRTIDTFSGLVMPVEPKDLLMLHPHITDFWDKRALMITEIIYILNCKKEDIQYALKKLRLPNK